MKLIKNYIYILIYEQIKKQKNKKDFNLNIYIKKKLYALAQRINLSSKKICYIYIKR